jgi:transposase-like protein
MAKRRRSLEREARWRDALRRHEASGLSVRAFCRREKLHESAFYFWRRTLAERDAEAASGATATKPKSVRSREPEFLPVVLRRESPTPGLSLELRSGNVVRFGASSPELIVAVIRALEGEVRS